VAAAIACVISPAAAIADEGGTSFWAPGTFASFSAIPQQPPGWSLAIVDYYTSANAGADVATARAITTGRIPSTVRLDETSTYKSGHDTLNINPGYAFATPVFGGQFSVGVTVAAGTQTVELDRALTAIVGSTVITRRVKEIGTTTGFGDLNPLAQLRWSSGVHNWTTYVTGNIPVGAYNARDLANIGVGHGAIDGGGGYTYYDAKKGSEFSVVTGATYNLINPNTSYQSGVDWHLDWALSQAVSKEIYVGAVGYIYHQISPDSGPGDHVGEFESRVMGVGPQINYTFTTGSVPGSQCRFRRANRTATNRGAPRSPNNAPAIGSPFSSPHYALIRCTSASETSKFAYTFCTSSCSFKFSMSLRSFSLCSSPTATVFCGRQTKAALRGSPNFASNALATAPY
jgi:hypothetical protein